jgi:hypothetical protein
MDVMKNSLSWIHVKTRVVHLLAMLPVRFFIFLLYVSPTHKKPPHSLFSPTLFVSGQFPLLLLAEFQPDNSQTKPRLFLKEKNC